MAVRIKGQKNCPFINYWGGLNTRASLATDSSMVHKTYVIQSVWMISNSSSHQETFEPRHEKMCLMSYANNSLISAFVVRCLDSIISLDFITEISRL